MCCVGLTLYFSLQFTKKSVVDAYTGFIRNVKRADDAIKIARTTKPAFDRFLQDMRRGKVERLSLTDLLAKPFQRIPRYRLLLQVRLGGLLVEADGCCFSG